MTIAGRADTRVGAPGLNAPDQGAEFSRSGYVASSVRAPREARSPASIVRSVDVGQGRHPGSVDDR